MSAPTSASKRPNLLQTRLDRAALSALFGAYESYFQCAYLESPTRVEIVPYRDPLLETRLDKWTHARVFGPELEIRWTRDELTCTVQALFEGQTLMAHPTSTIRPITQWDASPLHSRLDSVAQPRAVLLKGINVARLAPDHMLYDPEGGAWVSDSAARLLRYPLVPSDSARVALRCLDYTVNGYTVITRLVTLTGVADVETKAYEP